MYNKFCWSFKLLDNSKHIIYWIKFYEDKKDLRISIFLLLYRAVIVPFQDFEQNQAFGYELAKQTPEGEIKLLYT